MKYITQLLLISLTFLLVYLVGLGAVLTNTAAALKQLDDLEDPLPVSKMTSLTNEYRIKHMLPIVTENALLNKSAYNKVKVLCESKLFTHTPHGGVFQKEIVEVGYTYSHAGENLAKGFKSDAEAFNALLNSPTHLANIKGDYREIGVAHKECNGTRLTVIHYGKR